MKTRTLLKNVFIGLLSLYLTECTKPKLDIKDPVLKKPSLSDYVVSEKRFENDFNTTIESKCIKYKEGPYHFKEADADVFVKEYICVPNREPKDNDRYVVKAGYMFVIDNITGDGIKKELCVENQPYIIVKELNNGLSVWLIDPESNGKKRIALDGKFPKELIPKPFIRECY